MGIFILVFLFGFTAGYQTKTEVTKPKREADNAGRIHLIYPRV